MSDKLEALRLEAETLSGLMMQLAENEIDSDSFAVMSDLGENGQEHDCDLPITETALRASAVIDQLLAALEELNRQMISDAVDAEYARLDMKRRAEAAEQREGHLKASVDVLSAKNAELEQRLQQPIKLPLAEGESKQEYLDKVIEVLNGAGLQIRYHCPRCNGLLDLTSRPDGDHYCHQQAKVEGE